MACEVRSMNSFRSAIQSGKGLHPKNPLVRDKSDRGATGGDLVSVEVSRSEERSANHRDDDRHRLSAETATAVYKGKAQDVELINLSAGGAMIGAGFKPKMWDRIELSLGDGPALECAVRWLRGNRIGLEFAHETCIECDPEVRDALLLEVIRRSFPDVKALPSKTVEADVRTGASGVDEGKRGGIRHPLIWSGDIIYAHDSNRARLRNVSAGGALVEVSGNYPEGAEVLLDLGDAGQHFATISWVRGDQAGLAFRDPFDVACLAKAKPVLTPKRWKRPSFLDLADVGSAWDEQWSRQSLSEIRADLEGFLKR